MTVTCPECRSVFRVDPAKVPVSGVRARCAVCGGVIAIGGGTLPVSVAPEGALGGRAGGGGSGGGAGRAGVGGDMTAVAAGPAPVTAPPLPAAPVPGPPAAASPPAAAGPPAVVPRRPTPAYTDIPVAFPVFGRSSATPASVSVVAPVVLPEPPAPGPLAAVSGGASAPLWEPLPASQAGGAASASAPGSVPGSGGRVSINPFLRADPDTRARRLARALVSDLVAYHPQKREEGVREGTLRQLFRDDIRKSYEEYVEQVGREVAEQSRHFQDALNDILAGGRALF